MLDVQRERLKHLVANAILELWKKETGSLSPVVIEGTICITAGSGRTTVVQVSSHFSSSIPDGMEDNGPTYNTPKRKMLSLKNQFNFAPHIDTGSNAAMMAAYFEELSPASLISPSTEPSTVLPRRSSLHEAASMKRTLDNRRRDTSEQSMDISNVKGEDGSEEEDDEDVESLADTTANSSAGPVIPGTGFYVEESDDEGERKPADANDNNSDEKSTRNRDGSSSSGPLMSTPKPRSDSVESKDSALDLSSTKKEDDLALSPPQNYTAQVRDVIRQRLLASRRGSGDKSAPRSRTPSNSGANEQGEENSQSPPTPESIMSPLPPLMNLNLSSPTMLPLPYPAGLGHRGHTGSLHDILSLSRSREAPPFSPDMYNPHRPASTGAMDQNGNDKDSVYINDKGEPQKVYRCNFCSKTFLFKSKYYEHLPVHTNVRPFQCHLCSRTYKYKYDLRVHLRTHMGIPTKSTVCPFCTVKFDTNKMLRLHIQEFHHAGVGLTEQHGSHHADNTATVD